MNFEKNSINSIIGYGLKVAISSNDEFRHDREIAFGVEDPMVCRSIHGKNSTSVGLKSGSSPSGVSDILENSMDKLRTKPASQSTAGSHQRYANEGFASDSSTPMTVSYFDNEIENRGDFADYSSRSAAVTYSDKYGVSPGSATSAQGFPHPSRNAQMAGDAQYQPSHGSPPLNQGFLHHATHGHQQLPTEQVQHPRYASASSPQQTPMGTPQQGHHHRAPSAYANPQPQAYRSQHGYAPTMPGPYASYSAPAIPVYGTIRYVNPQHHAPQPVAYPQQSYGDRVVPRQDTHFRGGYAPPAAPPASYGYGAYPQQHLNRDDAYSASGTGAGAADRPLGRPSRSGGHGNDGFGPPSYRKCGGAGGFIRSSGPVADAVDLYNVDPHTIVYQVQFKQTVRHFTMRPGDLTPVQTGEFVIVQADRGEDLGVITDSFALHQFMEHLYAMRAYMDKEDQNVGYILRRASPPEAKLLVQKYQDEKRILKACEELAIHTYRLPLTIVDVEYQFDRHKITVFYDSAQRIDFRDLVRDLFSSFKARVWMKKINQLHGPGLQHAAALALATGVSYAGGNSAN